MIKKLLCLIVFAGCIKIAPAQCTSGYSTLIVTIVPDQYPSETSWNVKDQNGNTLGSGVNATGDTLCIPSNACVLFTILDSFGDGICCNYGNGAYTLTLNGSVVASGGQFSAQEEVSLNCGAGMSCSNPAIADTATYNITNFPSWYKFKPSTIGIYLLSTCFSQNNCNTVISVYENCNNSSGTTNAGTVFYNDDNAACGQLAEVSATMDTSKWYYIKVDQRSMTCSGDTIVFAIKYNGPVAGCTDPTACNYNPLATVSDTCMYPGNPGCPNGPDLELDQAEFENTLTLSTETATNCDVQEGCLTGFGTRTIIRFTTRINNIGQSDYFIGNPTSNPSQFTFNNCHGHPHYEGYAEYLLLDQNNERIPVGFKNGFCVIDLSCPPTIPAQYSCSNMGITAGCSDYYSSGLACQWIDITDVDTGLYKLIIRVNWDHSPDALGHYENSYENNWGYVCIRIIKNGGGQKSFVKLPNCTPFFDCTGAIFGAAEQDCNGTCNGTVKRGDLDLNLQRDTNDIILYENGILTNGISLGACNDLNNDGKISVWDIALLNNCRLKGAPNNSYCYFPRGVFNNQQSAQLELTNIHPAQKYFDVELLNPQSELKAFEFDISGVSISYIESLLDPTSSPLRIQNNNTKVLGFCLTDSLIDKSTFYQPLVRVYYNYIDSAAVCISNIIDIVNKDYQAISTSIGGTCLNTSGLVGITEVTNFNTLFVSPNPGKNIVTVSATISVLEKGNYFLKVNNLLGQTIINRVIKTNAIIIESIDVSLLADGVYFITIENKNGKVMERKFIKQ